MDNTLPDKTIIHDSPKVIIKTTQSHNDSVESQNDQSVEACRAKPKNGELCGSSMDLGKLMTKNAVEQESALSQREKLKRHWTAVAGRVLIPESWDHDAFLMDWMDCSSFDALLAPQGVDSARKALVAERQQASSRGQGKVIDVKSFT